MTRKEHNARAMKWYYANPNKTRIINANNYLLQNKKRESVRLQVLADHPCLVCGESRNGCLTFHHLDPDAKEYGVTSHSLTWKRMLREISKCVVLCFNCHMLHHNGGLQLPTCTSIDVSKYQP